MAETRSTSSLFPKVYFVTGRGVRRIEDSLRERGKPGRCCRRDRRRPEAYSPDHVLHEILTTEFLLNVWQCCAGRDDLELLTVQRRALERHAAFVIDGSGRNTRLKPDAMFLYKQAGGLMCCFLEMDNGTMNLRQMRSKFVRYHAWARSSPGQQYLLNLYRGHSATHARPVFRVLVVTRSRLSGRESQRLEALSRMTMKVSAESRHRVWLTTTTELQRSDREVGSMEDAIWRRGGGTELTGSPRGSRLFARSESTVVTCP